MRFNQIIEGKICNRRNKAIWKNGAIDGNLRLIPGRSESMELSWSKDELSQILDHGHLHKFPKGQIIFSAGDQANEIFYIQKGWVNVYRMTRDGQRVSIGLRNQGDFIGASETFRDNTRDCFAVALEAIEILAVNMGDFKRVLNERQSLTLKFQGFLSYRLHEAHTTLLDYACNRTQGRLAMTLLTMAEKSGIARNEKILVSLKLTQEELATIIGSSRQTVNMILNDFRKRDYIKMNGRVISEVDPVKLKKWLVVGI